MKTKLSKCFFLHAVINVLALMLCLPSSVQAYEYKVINISYSGYASTGNAINASGQAAGTDQGSRYWSEAYRYDINGVKTAIPSVYPGLSHTSAADINDNGVVAGGRVTVSGIPVRSNRLPSVANEGLAIKTA